MGLLNRATGIQLREALVGMTVLNSSQGRDLLLQYLPPALVNSLHRTDDKIIDLAAMIQACDSWLPDPHRADEHPIRILIENARDLVQGSAIAVQLQAVLDALPADTPPPAPVVPTMGAPPVPIAPAMGVAPEPAMTVSGAASAPVAEAATPSTPAPGPAVGDMAPHMNLLHIYSMHKGATTVVATLPNGQHALSAGDDGKVLVWELASGTVLHVLSLVGPVFAGVVLPGGQVGLFSTDDGGVSLRDLASGEERHSLEYHMVLRFLTLALTPDGSFGVGGGGDGKVRVWDLTDGTRLREIAGHNGAVRAVAVTPDGQQGLSGGEDGTVRVWSLHRDDQAHMMASPPSKVPVLAVAPDGRQALAGGDDGTVRLWDLASGGALRTLTGHTDGVSALAVLPDGRHVVTASNDHTVRLWDLDSGTELNRFEGGGPFRCVALAPDGHTVVGGDAAGQVYVFDLVGL